MVANYYFIVNYGISYFYFLFVKVLLHNEKENLSCQ